MADIVTVLDREIEPGIALVSVLPPNCGRCETDGGHCDVDHRQMRVRVPEHLRSSVHTGYRVQLGYPRVAVLRALGKLFVAPVIAAAAVTAGTWRWVATLPEAVLWHGVIAVVTAVAVIGVVAWRGGTDADLPVVSDLLEGATPELQPVDPIPVHR